MMRGWPRFLLRAFALILLIQLVVACAGLWFVVESNFPFHIERPDGTSYFALSVGLFLVSVCLLIVIGQAAILYSALRHPIAAMRAATAFVKSLPHRHGGKLKLDRTGVAELDALMLALNATAARLESQDQALGAASKGEQAHKRIFETLANASPLPEVLAQIALYVEQQNPDLICSLFVVDESGTNLLLQAAPSLSPEYNAAMLSMPVRDGVCCSGTAAYRCERVAIENIQEHPHWAAQRQMVISEGLVSCWAEPLFSSQRELLGTFAIYHRKEALPTPEEFALIQDAANLASVAIERKRTEEQLHLAAMVYSASTEAIFVSDASNYLIAVNPAFEHLTGYTAREVIGRPASFLKAERNPPDLPERINEALTSTGHWQGDVWSRRKNGEIYAESLTITAISDDNGNPRYHVALFSDITEKKNTEQAVWQQANNDALTNLPNRRLFRDRLVQDIARAGRARQQIALLFIDLDHFKQVNDVLGHDAGDTLLIEASQRIRACVRDSDTVARLGGDEFTVILYGGDCVAVAERVCEQILFSLTQPFTLGKEKAYISASIGITLYPNDAKDIENLLKNADQAMYAAKEIGRNGYSWFTAELQEAAQARHALANDLRNALPNGEFELYFQPIIDLESEHPAKAEVLLRWCHPVRGMISPDEFIPLAEEIGLIQDIGDWVFNEAIKQALSWPQVDGEPVCVSINKSPREFAAQDCAERWVEAIAQAGFDPQRIILEITEGAIIQDRHSVSEKLGRLRAAGVRIAIDDFGTGYSSLSYLKKYPIDFLKIDRSFVRDINADTSDRALCEAIITIANLMDLRVVAEGVEDAAQRDFLFNVGCDYCQGYLYSPPLSAWDFVEYLRNADLRLASRVA
ncbi:MAG: EAL domain-containing protein [Rhodocyclaceae bacterium]|nr:EAL domain-containing protein [Rhodocyclaceae bacterium]